MPQIPSCNTDLYRICSSIFPQKEQLQYLRLLAYNSKIIHRYQIKHSYKNRKFRRQCRATSRGEQHFNFLVRCEMVVTREGCWVAMVRIKMVPRPDLHGELSSVLIHVPRASAVLSICSARA